MSFAALVAVAALAAASAGASTAARGAAKRPPCTASALQAAAGTGTRVLRPVKCVASWAAADGVTKGKGGFDEVLLFRHATAGWVSVNRAKSCNRHQLPNKLYKFACTTS